MNNPITDYFINSTGSLYLNNLDVPEIYAMCDEDIEDW